MSNTNETSQDITSSDRDVCHDTSNDCAPSRMSREGTHVRKSVLLHHSQHSGSLVLTLGVPSTLEPCPEFAKLQSWFQSRLGSAFQLHHFLDGRYRHW